MMMVMMMMVMGMMKMKKNRMIGEEYLLPRGKHHSCLVHPQPYVVVVHHESWFPWQSNAIVPAFVVGPCDTIQMQWLIRHKRLLLPSWLHSVQSLIKCMCYTIPLHLYHLVERALTLDDISHTAYTKTSTCTYRKQPVSTLKLSYIAISNIPMP